MTIVKELVRFGDVFIVEKFRREYGLIGSNQIKKCVEKGALLKHLWRMK